MPFVTINELVTYYKLRTSLELFLQIGNGVIDSSKLKAFANNRANSFYNFFRSTLIRKKSIHEQTKKAALKFDLLVFGKEEEKMDYKTAKCCSTIPGDDVFGFITINDGIKIHNKNCPNAVSLQANYSYRILQAKWVDSSQQKHRVTLKIKGVDNTGLVNDVTKVLHDMKINLSGININGDIGYFEGILIIEINNKEQLTEIVRALKKVTGITKVIRENK